MLGAQALCLLMHLCKGALHTLSHALTCCTQSTGFAVELTLFCSGMARAMEKIQGELETIKLQLKRQEATENRLRKRLNKQDTTSSKRKEVAFTLLQLEAC